MDKKENDILKERRRAQQSKIELIKMRSQENSDEHIPYQDEIKPKTFKEKVINFWEYYKTAVISVIIAAVLLSVLVAQCATKKQEDLKIVIFDNQIVPHSQIAKMEEYFASVCGDINGDGETVVTVVDCTFQTGKSTAEYQQTKMQKLQTIIAADETAMLFITSNETYKFIDDLALDSNLLSDAVALGEEFYQKSSAGLYLREGLTISVRKIEDTLVENNKTAIEYNARATAFLEKYKGLEEK